VADETGRTDVDLEGERYELVGRIARGIGHDLNNTLSTVTTFADLLLAHTEPGSPAARDLAEIKDAGVAAAAIVRRLQLFARPGRHPAEDVDVAEVLRSMEPLLARLLAPNVTLEARSGSACPAVHAPRPRIEELLVALAGAARDALPTGGTLRIEAGAGPPLPGAGTPSATIEAAAAGPSVGSRARGDPFALTSSLVSELGGLLEAEPAADGGGTRVRIALPGGGEQA